MGDIANSLGTGLAKAFSSGNFQDLGKGLLSALGGIMTQVGQAAIALGLTILNVKLSLATLNGPQAIVAGIALVAAGALFSNVAQSSGNSMGTSSYSNSSGSTADSSNTTALQAMVANSNKMQLTTKVSGSDLLVLVQRATSSRNRTA